MKLTIHTATYNRAYILPKAYESLCAQTCKDFEWIIAAYSTGVPTLVMGYSVKARGIARDLFGTEEGYVLPVQSLRRPEELTEAFRGLLDKGDEIRTYMAKILPEYIERAMSAKLNLDDATARGEQTNILVRKVILKWMSLWKCKIK